MWLDIARLHLALDPLREVIAFLILARKLPDRRNVTVNQPLGTGLGLLDGGIDPARDDVLNPNKILMRAPLEISEILCARLLSNWAKASA
jgi:hypothetical protein